MVASVREDLSGSNIATQTQLRNITTRVRKSVVSIKSPPAMLGPEMAAPILWAPGIFGSFCRKTPTPIKFLLLGGGGVLVFF